MTTEWQGLKTHLTGIDFPADKYDLLDAARANSAPGEVIEALSSLSDDDVFDGAAELVRGLDRINRAS